MHIEGNLGGITAITKNTILFLEDLRGIKAVARETRICRSFFFLGERTLGVSGDLGG